MLRSKMACWKDGRNGERIPIVVECLDALARADADRLERCLKEVRDIKESSSEMQGRAGSSMSTDDLLAFARVLQVTRANFDLLAKCSHSDAAELEYRPDPASRGCEARG